MEVELTGGYSFEVTEETFNAIWQDPVPNEKTGKPKTPVKLGYFTRMESMIKKMVRHRMSRAEGDDRVKKDMMGFLVAYKACHDEFTKQLEKHNIE